MSKLTKTYGLNAVDWEQRTDFDRLRRERLGRARAALDASELGALLLFDMYNIRYVTATHIGTWATDKAARFALLPRADEPIMWDFGSAARHHQLFNPWLGKDRSRAGISTMRGSFSPEMGRAEDVARKIKVELEARGLLKEPLGVDLGEPPVLFALQKEGIEVVDGQQLMQNVRKVKTLDEITLLSTACMMVDAAYDELYRAMKPGMRENECVGLVAKGLYDLGSEFVEGVNAISGERANPHPHVYTDRALRPGDPGYFDIIHSYNGYLTYLYRTFAIGNPSPALGTSWPSTDGWSPPRIEEQLIVTKDGCEVITRFPAEELLVAGQRYYSVKGPLPTTREHESHKNTGRPTPKQRVLAGARAEGLPSLRG